MADFTTSKVNGNTVAASEWNQLAAINNAITSSGQTKTTADTTQTSKAMANYAAVSTFYTDGGAANAYVLSSIGSFEAPHAYADGMVIRFRAANDNTGASTINVDGIGVADLKKSDGTTDLEAGDINTTSDSTFRYDLANSAFIKKSESSRGNAVQVVNIQTGALSTGTATIPLDDTIPQNTEGFQVMELSITPTSATNKLLIEVLANVSTSIAQNSSIALFQDSTASAIAAAASGRDAVDSPIQPQIRHYMAAGTTSSTTFKVRVGNASGGTLSFNGRSGSRLFGGVSASSITITEIQV